AAAARHLLNAAADRLLARYWQLTAQVRHSVLTHSRQEGCCRVSDLQHAAGYDTQGEGDKYYRTDSNRRQTIEGYYRRIIISRFGEEHQHNNADVEECGCRASKHTDDNQPGCATLNCGQEHRELTGKTTRCWDSRERQQEEREHGRQYRRAAPQSGPLRNVVRFTRDGPGGVAFPNQCHTAERAHGRAAVPGEVEQHC